jgi:hypothetical protein
MLSAEAAPSYFLQCLIYNVPDYLFAGTWQEATRAVLKYLYESDLNGFVCQNGLQSLFGDSEEQWSSQKAAQTIHALVNLWNGWT